MLSPLDVVNQSFKKTLRGYDCREVDEFLDQVAETIQTQAQKIKELEQSLQKLNDQLKEYKELKDSIQQALVLAQKSAEECILSARKEAEAVLSEAQARSERMLKEAAEQAEKYKHEITHLCQVRSQYIAELKGILRKFDAMVGDLASQSLYKEEEMSLVKGDEKTPVA